MQDKSLGVRQSKGFNNITEHRTEETGTYNYIYDYTRTNKKKITRHKCNHLENIIKNYDHSNRMKKLDK